MHQLLDFMYQLLTFMHQLLTFMYVSTIDRTDQGVRDAVRVFQVFHLGCDETSVKPPLCTLNATEAIEVVQKWLS